MSKRSRKLAGSRLARGLAVGVLTVTVLVVVSRAGGGVARAAISGTQLMPADGQFTQVAAIRALDTRSGIGGVAAAPLAANQTVTFPVAGIGGVPGGGVNDVFAVISAFGPTASGALEEYNADIANPGIYTLPLTPGTDKSVSDLVSVSGTGQVSVTNASSGTVHVSVTILGYVQDQTLPTAGDTYVAVPVSGLLDTRNGLGAPAIAQIPGGGSVTVQVAGRGGVPADAAGLFAYLGVFNATSSGWVSAFPAGGIDPGLRVVSYSASHSMRNLYAGSLSSSGQLTLVNHGAQPVDLGMAIQGYVVSPTAAEAGTTYTGVIPARIADTRSGTGGVPATPIPANGSITFSATGTAGVPASGVSSVAENVAAQDPAATGFLSVYPAGSADTGPVMNFNGGGGQVNELAAPLVSSVSPTGLETITNHSGGTVNVTVSIHGYYMAADAPAAPATVSAVPSASSAIVTWAAPGDDGGAAITGYTVTASPDNITVSAGPGATQASLSGLTNASTDTYTVTAANSVGAGPAASASPPNVLAGTVVSPNAAATPVAGDEVSVILNDTSGPGGSVTIGAATTDAAGNWSFTVPPYAALPAAAQAAADANGGYINLDAIGSGVATVNGLQYNELAIGAKSAWVGTSTGTPQPGSPSTSSGPTMVMRPNGSDLAGQVTTMTPQVDPMISTVDPYAAAPTDSYGYQELGGSGTFNPNIAADGTNLANAAITPENSAATLSNCCAPYGCTNEFPTSGVLKTAYAWTTVGEYHSNWNVAGSVSYDQNAQTMTGAEIGLSGYNFTLAGYDLITKTSGSTDGLKGSSGGYDSHLLRLYMRYVEKRGEKRANLSRYSQGDGRTCAWWYQWDSTGIYNRGGGLPYSAPGPSVWNLPNAGFKTDGLNAFNAAMSAHRKWVTGHPYTFNKCISTGSGQTYGGAATFGITLPNGASAGLTFKVESVHSVQTQQCIESDSQSGQPHIYRVNPISGKRDDLHFLWGSNGSVLNNPATFYSY